MTETFASDPAPAPPTAAGLSPVQQEVVDQIGARRETWPEFPGELRYELRGELEKGIAEHVAMLPSDASIWANKHAISAVHGCEKRYLADREFPGWSVPLARGTVVHKAIEFSINWRGVPVPADLVDEAMASLEFGDQNISTFMQELSDGDRAQLRSDSVDLVSKFDECWPDLKKQWRPVTESKIRAELFGGQVVLQGKIDLTLGRAEGLKAGKVLVDLKSGKFQPQHMHDLRHYAMIETVRIGVPPRRIASYYLDQGRFHSEDVTEDHLFSAAQRAIDGIKRMIELELDQSNLRIATSPACRWCRALDTCEPGQVSLREFDDPLEDLL